MEAGKYENKHGVGILLNKKWRKRFADTEYISEWAIKNIDHSQPSEHHADERGTSPTRAMRTIISKKCSKQLRSTRIPARSAFKLWEETSMPNWDQAMEWKEQVLVRIH